MRDDQKNFVATNAVSLAQLNFLENFHAKGIYKNDTMVGFAFYGLDEDDQQYWIYRMMIDQSYQGLGYGKGAIKLIIEDICNIKEAHHQIIILPYEPENEHAIHIYEKIGFKKIEGLIIDS